jgi:hypothetical protein
MDRGFPVGRNFRSDELRVEVSPQATAFSLTWNDRGRYRELPRYIWHTGAIMFVCVGVFGIDELLPRSIFVCVGIASIAILQWRFHLHFASKKLLQRKTTMFGLQVAVENILLPDDAVFQICRVKNVEGSSCYLQISGNDFRYELLPLEGWDNFDNVCQSLTDAFFTTSLVARNSLTFTPPVDRPSL